MKSFRAFAAVAVLALGLVFCVSCRTGKPLAPADFSTTGWQVHQGQAVWKPSKKRPELAGDLLFATNSVGACFVQLTKTPFTMAEARVENGVWQIVFGGGKFSWRAKGNPPARFSWFQLPRVLSGKEPQKPWIFERKPDDSWRLANPRTGETLEGTLFQ